MSASFDMTRLLLPPRCYTCGLPMYPAYRAVFGIGNFARIYTQSLEEGRATPFKEDTMPEEVRTTLRSLNISRFCCFRMILGSRVYVPQR